MKTLKELNTELTENGINSRLDHKTFLERSGKSHYTKARKIVRTVDKPNQGIFAMLGLEDYTAQSNVSVHPEFAAYTFHLYGLSRKLLTYIIFYEMNNDTCRFFIDKDMMKRFREFCELFGEEELSDKAILQAARSLIRKNAMITLDQEEYMMNALIAGGANENKRRKLINFYSKLLEEKGFDTSVDFYPRYQFTSNV